jgi:hypothetical protein
MGWNKQSGDAWVLQRTAHFDKGKHDRALQLQLLSPLMSIDDAEKLCGALAAEVYAARVSEGAKSFGIEIQPWQEEIMRRLLPQIPKDGSFINRLVNDQIARRNAKTLAEQLPGESRDEWKARTFSLHYGSEGDYAKAVLDHWNTIFGDDEPPRSDGGGRLLCRKCGGVIMHGQYRFGSPQGGYEHMEGECLVGLKLPPPDLEDDDGCPND